MWNKPIFTGSARLSIKAVSCPIDESIYMKVKNENLLNLQAFSVSAELLILFYNRNKFGSFVLPVFFKKKME